jgi:hypothetical protein
MRLLVLQFATMLAVGCASVGIDKSAYQEKLQKVEVGMSKRDFQELFPSAVPRGAKQYAEGVVSVLQLHVKSYNFYPSADAEKRNPLTGMEGHPRWFYFYDNRLIQYGKPGDWPEKPDEIIEHRIR